MFNEIYQEAYLEKLAGWKNRLPTMSAPNVKRVVDAKILDRGKMLRGIQRGNKALIKKYNLNVANQPQKLIKGGPIESLIEQTDNQINNMGPIKRMLLSEKMDLRNYGPITGVSLKGSGKKTQILMQDITDPKIKKIFKNTTRAQQSAGNLRHEINEAREATRKGMLDGRGMDPTKSQRGMSKEELIKWRRGRGHFSPEVLKREQQVAARLGPGPLANINKLRAQEDKVNIKINKVIDRRRARTNRLSKMSGRIRRMKTNLIFGKR